MSTISEAHGVLLLDDVSPCFDVNLVWCSGTVTYIN